MSMNIYGNKTLNGVEITDMIDENNDIVYYNESHAGFFARLSGVMESKEHEDVIRPAIAIFHEAEPFHAIFAIELEGDYKNYMEENGDTNELFGRKLEECWMKSAEYGVNDEMSRKINEIKKIEDYITPIDFDSFEPTDTEGFEIEGSVKYEGKSYYVILHAFNGHRTYEKEASNQIYDEIHK